VNCGIDAAGGVLTAKQGPVGAFQKPHRPGTAPALGLRAGSDVHRLFCRPGWGIFNDCHRIRNGFAVAAAGPFDLAGVSALTPEWPAAAAAGVNRETAGDSRRAEATGGR